MKMGSSSDPKEILHLLRQPQENLEAFDSASVQRARQLLTALPSVSVEDVVALPEPLALGIVEAAVHERQVELITSLAESTVKGLSKIAKKALYRLRSSGIAVPERKVMAPESPAPKEDPAGADQLPGLLSAVTGTGERALVVPRSQRVGLEVAQVVFTDEHGIVHFSRTEMSRSAYRKSLRELDQPSAPPVLRVARGEARSILAEAWGRNERSQTPLPSGADDFLRRMEVSPVFTELDVPVPEADDERLSARGHLLHNEPEIQPWLPNEEQLRLLSAKAEAVNHSPLQMSDPQKAEQVMHQFRSAAREFFTTERSRLYGRRLWRMADFFSRTGRAEPAAIARAEARRLFHAHHQPLSRFAEFLFEKVLVQVSDTSKDTSDTSKLRQDTSSQEIQSPTSVRKTPGGLFLP